MLKVEKQDKKLHCQIENRSLKQIEVISKPNLPSVVVISGAENGKVRGMNIS